VSNGIALFIGVLKSCNLNDFQDLLGLQGKHEGRRVHGSLSC